MRTILSQPDNTVQGTDTSFHQVTVITTKAKITKAIGFEPEPIMDKSQYEWEVQVQPEHKEQYYYEVNEDFELLINPDGVFTDEEGYVITFTETVSL